MGAGRKAASPEEGTVSASSKLKCCCLRESAARKPRALPVLFQMPRSSSPPSALCPALLSLPGRAPGCPSGRGPARSGASTSPRRTPNPSATGKQGGVTSGDPTPTLLCKRLARALQPKQALSDQYLSAPGPREAERHTQNALSGTLGPETRIQSRPWEPAFALGRQSPFQSMSPPSAPGQPCEGTVAWGY